MKVTDLHPLLQQLYSPKTGYGVEKGKTAELANIWFVIPKPPGNSAPSGLKMELLREANETLNKLPPLSSLNSLDRLVLSLLVRREALQSSRIEGTWSTIEQVLTPASDTNTHEKSARASVIAYAHTLESSFSEAVDKGPSAISDQLIRNMHKEMMSRDPEFRGTPGLFRNEFTPGIYTIGGLGRPENSTYNPVPPGHVGKCLNENLQYFADEESIDLSRAGMAPGLIVRLARAHWHFEAVHPFSDGNGRVGRMLMVLQMITAGLTPLYLSGYIEAQKKEYYSALQSAQMRLDEAPLIHCLSSAIIESFDESQKTKKALLDLPNLWRSRTKIRQRSAAEKMLPLLLESPLVTVKFIQDKLEISQPAAKRAIDQLVSAKILRERTGNKRSRLFASEEVIELLARPFGELTETALSRAASLMTT